jgi:hypothetical protein
VPSASVRKPVRLVCEQAQSPAVREERSTGGTAAPYVSLTPTNRADTEESPLARRPHRGSDRNRRTADRLNLSSLNISSVSVQRRDGSSLNISSVSRPPAPRLSLVSPRATK